MSQAFSTPDGSYVFYVPDGTYRVGFFPDGPYWPLFYDGAETLAEANDVVVMGADVSNIDAHLRGIAPAEQWPPAATLSGAGQDAWGPQVAVGTDGAVTAVWYRKGRKPQPGAGDHAGDERILVRAGGPLSKPGEDASDPQVAMGAHGRAVVVWRRWDGTHYRVQASSRKVIGSWSAPVTLSKPGEDAWDPQVAMGPHGMAVVVWRRWDGTGYQVQAATRMAYGPWRSPVTLSTAGEDAWDPQVAVGSDGAAIAVWSRSDGTHDQVQATTRAANGSWSSPVTLSEPGGMHLNPQVAVASDGAATVVWRRWDGSTDQIRASSRAAEGVWSTPATLSTGKRGRRNAPPGGGAIQTEWSPLCGFGFGGTAAPAGFRLRRGRRVGCGRGRRPFRAFYNDAEAPQVAAGPDGKATVVWRAPFAFSATFEDFREQVVAATRQADGSWSARVDSGGGQVARLRLSGGYGIGMAPLRRCGSCATVPMTGGSRASRWFRSPAAALSP